MTNTLELKASFIRKGYTAGGIAKMLGITEASMTNKVLNKTSFKPDEMVKIKKILNLSEEEFKNIFFYEGL